jgi:membrane protease YdiL (CAAX protease family)
MKTIAARFPVLFALTTTSIAMLCLVWPLWVPGLTLATQIILGRIVICAFAIAMLTYLGWWGEAGFIRLTSWRILVPYLPLLALIILSKVTEVTKLGIRVTDLELIILGVVVYLAGGFMEEAIFRGLVLRTLLPGGLVRAPLLSSLIFASAHFLNLIGGANLNDTILQVIVAFLIGLAFAAPLAVTRNIWPAVFIHALNNIGGYLTLGGFLNTAVTSQNPTLNEAIGAILFPLLLAIYSFWLLRRAGRRMGLRDVTGKQNLAVDRLGGSSIGV